MVALRVTYGKPVITDDAREIFDTEGAWRLLKSDSSYYVLLSSPGLNPPLYKVLAIDSGLAHGTIQIDVDSERTSRKDLPVGRYPLHYPLDEMLIANLLARGRGVEMHGLGVVHEGRGFMFTGKSGAGKSTLGKLWQARPGVEILSSDRLIVRPRDGNNAAGQAGFRLFGTPWHGDGQRAYGGAELAAILILRQASDNRLVELPPVEVAAALLVRSFPTFWDTLGLQSTVDLLGRISMEVPCFELRFRPEQAAIDAVLTALG